jgi:hypothetical protein
VTLTDLPQDLEKQALVTRDLNRYIWWHTIRPLVSEEVIEEHRRTPVGKHSPALDMILTFLRRDPVPENPQLVAVVLKADEEWGIGEYYRTRGVPVRVRPGTFRSIDDLEHSVFLERLAAVEAAYGELGA